MTIQLRALSPADHPALNRVALDLHAHHVAGAPEAFRMPQAMFEATYIPEANTNPDHFLRGAFDGETLTGFVFAYIREWADEPMHVPRRWVVVEMIGVETPYRGQGIGQQLMAAAESWARDKGIDRMTLGVWAFNTGAIRFYERQGYDTFMVWMRKTVDDDLE